ncbi:unnamed protein product [Candida verbasci]|uniref:Aminodeoxychorismate lyase n=1 Tax=Candida verbasci TaxID=1227364 RepID=A0A9W4XBQ9_9ASCO|nr:unnamed protein product [Candida verbasci]
MNCEINSYIDEYNTSQFDILSTIRFDPNLSTIPPFLIDDLTIENFFLLNEHVERLRFTLQYFTKERFEITTEIVFKQLVEAFKSLNKLVFVPYKIRCLTNLNGDCKFEFHEITNRLNLLNGLFPNVSNGDCKFKYHEITDRLNLLNSLFPNVVNEFDFLNELQLENDQDEIWDIYINNDCTMISPFTSFKTTNRDHYNTARQLLPNKKPGKEEVLLYNPQYNLMEGSITNIAVKRFDNWITPMLSSGCLCGVMRHFLLRKNFIQEDIINICSLQPGEEVLLFNAIIGVVKGRIVENHMAEPLNYDHLGT